MSDYFEDGTPLLHPANDHRGPIAQAVQDIARKGGGIRVTPTGNATERTLADAADRAFRGQSERLVTIIDETMLLHSTAGNPTIDRWRDLREWGVFASSSQCYLDAIVEKPDGQGGWVPCVFVDDGLAPPGVDELDVEGYAFDFGFLADDLSTPVADIPGPALSTTSGNASGSDPRLITGDSFSHPIAQLTRLRAVARADCSSGLYDALGYRLHMIARVPDMSARAPIVVPIPAADETWVIPPTEINLPDMGLTSHAGNIALVALLQRDGQTIRVEDLRQGFTGETLDPPTYPVKLFTGLSSPHQRWYDAAHNGNNVFAATGIVTGGSHYAARLGSCVEWIADKIVVAAFRRGAMLIEYVAEMGGAPVPVPPGSADGCTLKIVFLRAPRWAETFPPFHRAFAPYAAPVPAAFADQTTVPAKYLPLPVEQAGIWMTGGRVNGTHALRSEIAAFVSDEITGDGTPQVTPHGLGGVPSRVRVVPLRWSAGQAGPGAPTVDATNVTVTAPVGLIYCVMAWPP